MATLAVVSTDQVAPKERIPYWKDLIWQLLGRLRSEARSEGEFRGRMAHCDAGDVKLCRLSATSHRVARTPDLIRQDDRGFLKVVFQLEGTTWFEQGGRKTLLSPGEWSIYDTMKAYTVSNTSDIEQMVLLAPREKILAAHLNPDELLVQRYDARNGIGRIAGELLYKAFEEIETCSAESAETIGDAVAQLLRQSLMERAGKPTSLTLREALRDRIKTYIHRNLRDPNLSLDQIAAALRCSKRNLHKAFSNDGATISDSIWRLRLDHCRRDLVSPACAWKSITEIAYSWGFSSSTHFSKAFREAYGTSPKLYRLAAGSEAAPAEEGIVVAQAGADQLARKVMREGVASN
ncbi:MAG: helix-turn-helix domain-containing protein [Rhodocyclales bacterium]|jgi:AraC-like DNA-binding protein|nr:helix-turn-helix domain-containing protein [Rhodocyclales bacterium]